MSGHREENAAGPGDTSHVYCKDGKYLRVMQRTTHTGHHQDIRWVDDLDHATVFAGPPESVPLLHRIDKALLEDAEILPAQQVVLLTGAEEEREKVDPRMPLKEVLERLCIHDPRNPYHETALGDPEDEPREPRHDCACDNCFHGHDKLALEILRLQEGFEKVPRTADGHIIYPGMPVFIEYAYTVEKVKPATIYCVEGDDGVASEQNRYFCVLSENRWFDESRDRWDNGNTEHVNRVYASEAECLRVAHEKHARLQEERAAREARKAASSPPNQGADK